ncbi:diguanylate cyclase (GGDEF)-like protein [Micromonospora sp. M71_S20]|uniref:GGDEF domain-containing protein n=1 Tax=Micromonospora sp. M71_S20 TaxID=592872 RepID=UPI000F1EBD30|nr:GGDEF domain-containing protein [Micromonospora sp. M71_S20]RLK12675.1 diguanylate cyclase (GGDEF)-like protein [Micromonospora sp. M71_S20]
MHDPITYALLLGTSASCFALIAQNRHLRSALNAARHDADHDALTGLPNRRALVAHLNGLLSDRKRPVSVIMLDLNRFKDINDEHGHATGDAVLREVAHVLTELRMPRAFAGRMGGDEFAVVVDGDDDLSRAYAHAVADALNHRMIMIQWQTFGCHASVGLAVANNSHRTAFELLHHADIAMCVAKERGGSVQEYRPGLTIAPRTGNHRRRYR